MLHGFTFSHDCHRMQGFKKGMWPGHGGSKNLFTVLYLSIFVLLWVQTTKKIIVQDAFVTSCIIISCNIAFPSNIFLTNGFLNGCYAAVENIVTLLARGTCSVSRELCTSFCCNLCCCDYILNSWWIHSIHLPILSMVVSPAMGQSYDNYKETLKTVGIIDRYITTTKRIKALSTVLEFIVETCKWCTV